jgi:hypothetical protein
MPDPLAPAIGAHLATLNLFREPDGTLEITVAEGVGALHEIDRVRFGGKPIDYIEARIVEAADRIRARLGLPASDPVRAQFESECG